MRSFDKPPTDHSHQVSILQDRGMVINDPDQAAFYLQHINYYRLAAYWLPFEADHGTHRFVPGTTFDSVLNLYVFDRELRLLVMDAIERIEVSVRSQWAYWMAHHHGPHAHLDARWACNTTQWHNDVATLHKAVSRSTEEFIEHHLATYQESLPPMWAVCEVMSLGQLSRWYQNLKPMITRSKIANAYGLDESVLRSWLHHLTVVRNTCAHHSRLWNRELSFPPKRPKNKPAKLGQQFAPPRTIYNTFVLLLYCMEQIAPTPHWRQRLKDLIQTHGISTSSMGFPADWQQYPIWA